MNQTISKSLALLALGAGFVSFGQQKTNPEQPNILFLFADDQRADALGCAGNPYIKTPNIDRLAANGVRFVNAYVMWPSRDYLCSQPRHADEW